MSGSSISSTGSAAIICWPAAKCVITVPLATWAELGLCLDTALISKPCSCACQLNPVHGSESAVTSVNSASMATNKALTATVSRGDGINTKWLPVFLRDPVMGHWLLVNMPLASETGNKKVAMTVLSVTEQHPRLRGRWLHRNMPLSAWQERANGKADKL